MFRIVFATVVYVALAAQALALEPREGWAVHATGKSFGALVSSVRAAVGAAPIAIVTQASASDGARMQSHEIAGNRVFGLYRNDYARRMLASSVAAGIEAPIRMYVTENADGTATLSYKRPSAVFAPYFDEGGAALRELADELDAIFADIAHAAAGE